MAQFFPWMGIC